MKVFRHVCRTDLLQPLVGGALPLPNWHWALVRLASDGGAKRPFPHLPVQGYNAEQAVIGPPNRPLLQGDERLAPASLFAHPREPK